MVAWVRKEEKNAFENRQRKREAEGRPRSRVHLG